MVYYPFLICNDYITIIYGFIAWFINIDKWITVDDISKIYIYTYKITVYKCTLSQVPLVAYHLSSGSRHKDSTKS